ncbi:YkgJ family cysteine cluster protein [Ningiella sp. W23]|uniref:YkgJ family cysteine cluster protein n=1 Tax=Ningiella sp. W23 TaxID=3023715 RepID=UPI003756ABE3
MKDCNQCGKCCIKYGDGGISVTQDEINLWELFNPDIFEYVRGDEIWFDPHSKKRLRLCPFLRCESTTSSSAPKYSCSIYEHRPDDCRQYPSLISEMIRDECEMIEISDITEAAKAQHKLNKLMQR